MLGETKEMTQNIVNKIQVIDFILQALNLCHKNDKEKVDALFNRASHHKMKLADEVLRLVGAVELSPAVEEKKQ
jgi:hypothetical protein